jgi:hypothetical protein
VPCMAGHVADGLASTANSIEAFQSSQDRSNSPQ